MSRWWRAYDESVDDPKLLLLSDRAHRGWFNVLCVASMYGGTLPSLPVVAVKLRSTPAKVKVLLDELKSAVLLDEVDGKLTPHNWNGRQYKSDVSTERVKRFRNGKRNVSETSPETEADTESERKKEDSRTVAKATRPADEHFENFKRSYPKRKGGNPWPPARKLFENAIRAGTDPLAIIAAVKAGVGYDRDKIGSEYIPQAVKWLRDERYRDHHPPSTAGPLIAPTGAPSDEELRKKYGQPSHAVSSETQAGSDNGARADHDPELQRQSAEIRPSLRAL